MKMQTWNLNHVEVGAGVVCEDDEERIGLDRR